MSPSRQNPASKRFVRAGALSAAFAALLTSPIVTAQICPFDNGGSTLQNDGLVLTRYALGLRGAPMVANTSFAAADAATIESTIACPSCGLRVTDDKDALNNPIFTVADATIISRKIAGFQGASLTNGLALGVGTRNTPAAVQSFLLAGCGVTGGTVTSVGAGYGLVANGPNVVGNSIVSNGLIELANGYILPQGCTAGQVPKSAGNGQWNCAADNAGGGVTNAFVNGGNAFGAPGVLGTTDGQPLTVGIGSGRGLRILPAGDASAPNVINGSASNTVGNSGGTQRGVTVAGGKDNRGGTPDGSNGWYSTIGGGRNNKTGKDDNTGGDYATIAGGSWNTASGLVSTVAGGDENTASGDYSTVAGGSSNTASGQYSAVAGGAQNRASGDYSFAAGTNANADQDGCAMFNFWSTLAPYGCSSRQNIVNIGADKGLVVNFGSPTATSIGNQWVAIGTLSAGNVINTSTGARLTAGGVWANSSDRAQKENLQAINAKSVLQKVLALPVTTWNYLSEGSQTRRMGPMAQDFYAAFGLGNDNKSIGTVDAQGVALAAIQGLNQVVQEKTREIATLKARLAAIEKRLGL